MPDVAKLSVVVDADTSQAEKGLDQLGTKVGSAGSAIATAFGGVAIAGLAGLAAGLSTAVVAGADFEKQMSAIKAVSGSTAEEMETLSSLALQLGAESAFSASEAAKGIEELVKAGVSIQDVMGGAAKSALDLAAAGAIEVGEAAEIASNAMNVFGLKGSDVAHVADVIAGAANASAISVSDYKFSLSAAGAVAATVGVGFDDLSTAIALMGNAGIKGSDAGTSLKTMLLNLANPTKEAKIVLEQLGIVTEDGTNKFYTAEGGLKSLSEVSGILQEATKDLSDTQKIAALQTMFGTDAVRAAAIMAEAGAAGFDELAASIGKVTAEAVAQERLNNLAGAWEQLKGSLETAAITIGLQLMPALTAITKWVTDAVNAIIPKLSDIGKTFSDTFGPELAAEMSATLGEIRTTVDTVMSAIATLTREHGDEISLSWNGTWRKVVEDALSMTRELLAVIRLFAKASEGDWRGVWTEMTKISDEEGKRQTAAMQRNADVGQKIIDTFTNGALTKTQTSLNDMGKAIETGWADLTTKTQAGTAAVLKPIEDAWNTAKSTTETIFRAIANVLTAIWEEIHTKVIQPKLDAITASVEAAWNDVKAKTTAALDPVLAYVRDTIFEPIRLAVETSVNAARDAAAAAWQAISDKAYAILDPVLKYISDTIFGPMQTKVESSSTGISKAFTEAINSVKTTVDGALQSVKSVWETTWTAIQKAAESPKQAMEVLIDLVNKLKSIMPEWLIPHSPTPFQVGLEGILKAAKQMDGAIGSMGGAFAGAAGDVGQWLQVAMRAAGVGDDWLGGLARLVSWESSGNPNAVNPQTVAGQHATGLMQTLPSTFRAYALPGMGDIFNPIHNAAAAIRYILDTYGHVNRIPGVGSGNHAEFPGYAEGGWAGLHGPELAWLGERGPEYVVPASRMGGGATVVHIHMEGSQVYDGRGFVDLMVGSLEKAERGGRIVKVTR